MRQEIINALLERPVEDIIREELLIATEEEIHQASILVRGKRTKARLDAFERELRIRQKPPFEKNFKSDYEKKLFANEWNRVVALFK